MAKTIDRPAFVRRTPLAFLIALASVYAIGLSNIGSWLPDLNCLPLDIDIRLDPAGASLGSHSIRLITLCARRSYACD